jgi:hypothetical protein
MPAFAWMASSTVRNVAKLVTFRSRILVATEAKVIHMQIDADPRLAAAAGGAVRYFADAAGLENERVSQLQSAVVAACQEAFDHLSKTQPHLDVTLTRLADRIEVALAHHGDMAPAVGLDVMAGLSWPTGTDSRSPAQSPFSGIDRVQYETHSDIAITRLTTYL